MRAVFFGTPEWAVPSLGALLGSEIEVTAVVTNPDRPAGRGMDVKAPPVKDMAIGAGVDVWQPQRVRDEGFRDLLAEVTPDVCVVVAYGRILPVELLAIPRHGFVNVHFSLLPAYRGAAPVQRAIMAAEERTGVSIMILTEGMDEGPVLASEAVAIGERETAGELGERLAVVGAELLVRTLPGYAAGTSSPQEQDHERATYAPKISSEEAKIDWTWEWRKIDAHVRGLNPTPGAWSTLNDKRLKVHAVEAAPGALEPGRLNLDDGLLVGTGDGALRLVEVQPAGGRRMGGKELARGLRLTEGARLG